MNRTNGARLMLAASALALCDHAALERGHKAADPAEAYRKKEAAAAGASPEIKELVDAFTKSHDKVKEIAEKALTETASGTEMAKKSKEAADEALVGMNELKATLDAAVQKFSRSSDNATAFPTMGEKFIEGFQEKGASSSDRGRWGVTMDRKDITTANGTVGAGRSPGTSLQGSTRVPGIINLQDRRMTIRDLLTPGNMTGGFIEYVKETGFTNNAAMVAEGALKPKSEITFNLVSTPARVIAHIFKGSRQMMDDAPMLASYIDGRAEYGLMYQEEQQLLNGDGTGQNLYGIMPQATAYALPAGAVVVGENPIDRLRLGILQVALAEYPATGFVMHPTKWTNIELTKDGEGRYILGNPQGLAAASLWRLPVVETQSIALNSWLTGAFKLGAQIFDRMAVEILLSTENEDDFVKNMMTIRAEERLALAVYRPESFVAGNFTFP